ncbi:MAG: macro domain-containing protein [Actinobacteria bacterium]|nr:macro domain-containing protein [Actinomycetota bacterium]
MAIELLKADITAQEVDAIVNAANSHLEHVGGLARAIALAAGPALTEASFEAPFVPVGDAFATPAGKLHAKIVIHAVGPVWRGGGQGEKELLAAAYRNSIAKAAELDCNSVALPAISTGVYGYPVELAAPTALAAVYEALSGHPEVRVARFCLFSDYDYEMFGAAAEAEGVPIIELEPPR